MTEPEDGRIDWNKFTTIQDECVPVPEPFTSDNTVWVFLYFSDMPPKEHQTKCMAARHRQQKPKAAILELIVDMTARKYHMWAACKVCHQKMMGVYHDG